MFARLLSSDDDDDYDDDDGEVALQAKLSVNPCTNMMMMMIIIEIIHLVCLDEQSPSSRLDAGRCCRHNLFIVQFHSIDTQRVVYKYINSHIGIAKFHHSLFCTDCFPEILFSALILYAHYL